MNDKILTMAFMLLFISIGINAFLLMASSNLLDESGDPLNIYYGIEANQTEYITDASSIDINATTEFSGTETGQGEGFTPATIFGLPIGIHYTNDLKKLGIGIQLVLQRLSVSFPLMAPLLNGITSFVFLLQGLAIAYLMSVLVRAIFGRFR